MSVLSVLAYKLYAPQNSRSHIFYMETVGDSPTRNMLKPQDINKTNVTSRVNNCQSASSSYLLDVSTIFVEITSLMKVVCRCVKHS